VSWKRIEKVYTYTDENGLVLFQKRRWIPKEFSYYPNKPKDADRYVYRLPELLAGIQAGRRIHWVEGEKDADALVAAGEVATSVHQGAGKVTPEQAAWFIGAREVWVWMDKDWYGDPPHPEVGAYDAALRTNQLIDAGVQPANIWPVCARGEGNKDAADHLAAGFAPDAAVPVDEDWLERWAQEYRPRSARKLGYR